jgi:hypothetical protein
MVVKFIPNTIGVLFITAFFILLGALLYALPVWLIWNYIMPKIFNLPAINIIDAFLLNVLTGILFRSKEKQQ